jgi:3-hydroxyisobutyrate dehydrogenase-like beta-hydroxyacid dehydrogenase
MKIGFLGLGKMGLPIARNLLKHGHQIFPIVSGAHNQSGAEQMQHAGGQTAREDVTGCEAVISCLPKAEDVAAAMTRFLSEKKGVKVWLDLTTGSPQAAEELSSLCAKHDIHFTDCPVSGSTEMAENGALTCFAGAVRGTSEILDRLLFEIGGEKVFYFAGVGRGYAAKLVNQYIHILNLAVLSEAFKSARDSGIDLEQLLAALNTASSGSQMMTRFGPALVSGKHEPTFSLKHALKDLKIIAASPQPLGPLLGEGIKLFEMAAQAGHSEKNFSSVHLLENHPS